MFKRYKIIVMAFLNVAASNLSYADQSSGVTVQLFGWRWADVAHECPYLHQAGYAAVKIDPPNEHAVVLGHPWWATYQPVTYQLNKQQGGEAAYKAMIDTCHKSDIKIIADVVLNHMADPNNPSVQKYGTNGTKFSNYNYPDLIANHNWKFTYNQFHHSYPGGNCSFGEQNKGLTREKLLNCNLVGLPDLNQADPVVRLVQRHYLENLLKLGTDGFRVDAAMHMPARYLHQLFYGLKTYNGKAPFIEQEVLSTSADPIKPSEYFNTGLVTNYAYSNYLLDTFSTEPRLTLNQLVHKMTSEEGLGETFPSRYARSYVSNHDTEQKESFNFTLISLNQKKYNQWVLAHAFLFAWPYGEPSVYSGYKFYEGNSPNPSKPVWEQGALACSQQNSPWLCQHRLPIMVALVDFYNQMEQDRANQVCHLSVSKNQLSFGRCNSKGQTIAYMLMNHDDKPFHFKHNIQMISGNYFAIVYQNHQYEHKTITINQGKPWSWDLPAESFILIYNKKA